MGDRGDGRAGSRMDIIILLLTFNILGFKICLLIASIVCSHSSVDTLQSALIPTIARSDSLSSLKLFSQIIDIN